MTQNESNVQINSLAGPNTLNYEESIGNDLQGTFYDVNPAVNLSLKNNEDSIKVLKRFRIYILGVETVINIGSIYLETDDVYSLDQRQEVEPRSVKSRKLKFKFKTVNIRNTHKMLV